MNIIILLIVIALAAGLAWQWYTHRPQYMPPLPAALRGGLHMLYYGPVDGCEDHVTEAFELNWGGAADTAAKMRRHGLPTWLTLSGECFSPGDFRPLADAEQRVWSTLQTLKAAGVLAQVIVLYPLDEPDGHGVSDAEMLAMCDTLRKVAGQFPELVGVKLAATYSMGQGQPVLPGFYAMDLVGYDNYGLGSNIFTSAEFGSMRSVLAPHQQYFSLPGGGDPWRQPIEAFRREANNDPLCYGVCAFMAGVRHDDPKNPNMPGILINGMLPSYRAVGLEIKGNP